MKCVIWTLIKIYYHEIVKLDINIWNHTQYKVFFNNQSISMTKQKEEKPEEEPLSKDELFQTLQSERNKYFMWEYYDDHDEVYFLGRFFCFVDLPHA